MGKKSRRNNKNNGGPIRKGRLAAVPDNIFMTLHRLLMEACNFEEILEVESKYRHYDTFSQDPKKTRLFFMRSALQSVTIQKMKLAWNARLIITKEPKSEWRS